MKTTAELLLFFTTAVGGSSFAQTINNGGFNGTSIPSSSMTPSIYSWGNGITSQVGNTWNYVDTGTYNSVALWDFDAMPTSQAGPGELYDPFGAVPQSTDGGQFAVFYGPEGDLGLSQTLSGFQPNTVYNLSFQMANMNIGLQYYGPYISNTDVRHSWDGYFAVSLTNTVQSTLDSPTLGYFIQNDINQSELGPWSNVTLQFTTNAAVTPTTNLTLTFLKKDGPNHQISPHYFGNNFGGQLALDGVSITQAVPEPSSALFTVAAGLLGLAFRRRTSLV